MPGNRQIGTDLDAPDRIDRRAERAPDVRSAHARPPTSTVAACDVLVADARRRPASTFVTRAVRPDLHAERFEIAHRASRELLVERRQDARPGFDQDHARLARIDAAKIARQRVAAHLADRARELHARRSAADDDEREMAPSRVEVLIALRRFERFEHAAADLGGLRQRLQARARSAPIPRDRSTRAASRRRAADSRT